MLLRSPFLCTHTEIEGFMERPPEGCRALWLNLKAQVPESSNLSILEYGYQVFCQGDDLQAQAALARAWMAYEAAMNMYPAQPPTLGSTDGAALIARYRIQSHYLLHRCFVQEDILAQAQTLKAMPLTLVHGDLDALCPFTNSQAIQHAVPQAKLIRVSGGGHDLTDPGMLDATFEGLKQWDRYLP
jgi:proline iminopeptidase